MVLVPTLIHRSHAAVEGPVLSQCKGTPIAEAREDDGKRTSRY